MDDEEALIETLRGLEMPREGLREWLRQTRSFCEAHGGRRVYGELLGLFDECDALIERGEPRGGGR